MRGECKLREQEILSSRHPLIKQYRRLAGSRRHRFLSGRLPLEGPNLIKEALRAGIVPEAVFYTPCYREKSGRFILDLPAEVKRYAVTPELFKTMALTDTPQEVAALAPMPVSLNLPGKPVAGGTGLAAGENKVVSSDKAGKMVLGLLLDRLRDPGNLGAIIRTAAAAGADGVYYTSETVDPYSPKVMRSTAGAVFHLPLVSISDPRLWLAELKNQGVQVLTTGPGQGRYYWEADLRLPTVFIIGNESHGVAPALAAGADQRIFIPQPGWSSSLNAAVSAAILLYEALRQRK